MNDDRTARDELLLRTRVWLLDNFAGSDIRQPAFWRRGLKEVMEANEALCVRSFDELGHAMKYAAATGIHTQDALLVAEIADRTDAMRSRRGIGLYDDVPGLVARVVGTWLLNAPGGLLEGLETLAGSLDEEDGT